MVANKLPMCRETFALLMLIIQDCTQKKIDKQNNRQFNPINHSLI